MLVVITYDVSTETGEGRRRLSKVSKCCVRFGQRVQNSVFECNIDYGQFIKLQNALRELIDEKQDSLRFYNLGNNYETKVIHVGAKQSIALQGDLIV